jgi:hypothetical protein
MMESDDGRAIRLGAIHPSREIIRLAGRFAYTFKS